jgi:molybdopterin-containing oxidoreductase family membrane subunit
VNPPNWVRGLACLSVIWAFSIHTVTAFLYAGLPGRHYWLTAIMAARFLASAFCSGPALLLLLLLLLRRLTSFNPGKAVVRGLSLIIAYAMCINVFFYVLEIFTAFYSGIPSHQHPIAFLFMGHEGVSAWVNGWMWTAALFALLSIVLLVTPQFRTNDKILPWTLIMLVIATWIDKGLGLLIGGFTPTPFESYSLYTPSFWEVSVGLGIFGIGALVVSILWKIALDVKKEAGVEFELADC